MNRGSEGNDTMQFTFNGTIESVEEEDITELRKMIAGPKAFFVLNEVHQEIFRPAYRSGYSDPNISKFFSKEVPEAEQEARIDLILAMSEKFLELLSSSGICLDY